MPDAEGLPVPETTAEPQEDIRSSQELVKFWQDRIDCASRALKEKDTLSNWKRWTDKAAGRWDRGTTKGDYAVVNKPYSIITSAVNQIYSRNPRYVVKSRRPGEQFTRYAGLLTGLLDWLVHEIGVKREAKLCVKQAFTIGHSFLKVFWQSKMKTHMIATPQVVVDPTLGTGKVTPQQIPIQVDYGNPRVRWVNAKDVRFDPDAERIEDCRWIAHRVPRPTKAVKADPKYKNTETLKATATGGGAKETRLLLQESDGYTTDRSDSDRTILWEIEDFENKKFITVAEGHDLPLREEDDEYTILEELGMWLHLEADEDLDSPLGIGIMAIIEGLADEKNVLRRRYLNHTRRALTKVLVTEGAMDEKALTDFESGDDARISKVTNIDGVRALDIPNLPMDNRYVENAIDRDMAETSGSSDLQRGISPEGGQTATEIAAIGANERVRLSARTDQVEGLMTKLGEKLLKLCRAYMKTPQVVEIEGPTGSDWQEFTPREIEGEFDVSVEFGSTVLKDEIERRQLDQNLLNLVSQDPLVNRVEILKDLFRDFGKKDVERYLNMPMVNFDAYAQAITQAVQTGNVELAIATLQTIIQQYSPPAKGPVTPQPGMPSARPMGQQLAAGPPKGGEGPMGAVQNPGAIRAAFLGNNNAVKA